MIELSRSMLQPSSEHLTISTKVGSYATWWNVAGTWICMWIVDADINRDGTGVTILHGDSEFAKDLGDWCEGEEPFIEDYSCDFINNVAKIAREYSNKYPGLDIFLDLFKEEMEDEFDRSLDNDDDFPICEDTGADRPAVTST